MAFGSFDKGPGAPMAEINTTPLVDVMLVLLVVFIITAPLLTQAVKVDLPKAAASAHEEKPEAIRLAIKAANAAGAFVVENVVEIAKTSALAIAVGDRVFWDAAAKVVNKTTTGQQCVGVAVEAAANPSATVKIKLGHYVPSAT